MNSTPPECATEIIKQTLNSREFELLEQVGKGGYASVYKVFSQKYNQVFAVKVFGMNYPEKELESFRREVEIIRNLDHPNIISVYDVFYDREYAYLIMEYCDGETLYEYVNKNYPLPQSEQSVLMQSILNAVAYCHRNEVVHNDIKPQNILLDKYGRIKLTDFGIAEYIKQGEKRSSGKGSLMYMAPEIFKGKPYDPYKADSWSVGITFYFIAMGTLPWISRTREDIKNEIANGYVFISDKISAHIAKKIRALLEYNPEQRPDLNAWGVVFPISPITKKNGHPLPGLMHRTTTSVSQLMQLNLRTSCFNSSCLTPKICVPAKNKRKI